MDTKSQTVVCAMAYLLLVHELVTMEEERTPYHDSSRTGNDLYKELTQTRSEQRFLDFTRMTRFTFSSLLQLLLDEGGLTPSSTCGVKITGGEKVMMLIQALKGHSVRVIAEMFQHSISTVSFAIRAATKAMLKVKARLYTPPLEGEATHHKISSSVKFSPYFDDCVGAIDGTHLSVLPEGGFAGSWRDRKKGITQNVLSACSFDATFQYCLYGWEGSAHDGKVLADARLAKGFRCYTENFT